MIFRAKNGAEIIEKINIREDEALRECIMRECKEELIDEINEKLLEFY